MTKLRRCLVAVLLPALVMVSGCSSRHGFTDNDNCDYLVFAETSESATLPRVTFACVNNDFSLDFTVRVTFIGPSSENGGLGNPPDATPLSHFLLEHFDVSFRNLSTGGSVQGVDVPRSWRRSIQSIFDLSEDTALALTGFAILQAGAKSEAPLNNPAFYSSPAGTVFEATITFWGHPLQNDNAWCYGTMRYNFTVAPCL